MRTLHLKPYRHERIQSGHLWAFAGEIAEDLTLSEPGDPVSLCEARGKLLGRGYVNPHSLIAVRLLTTGEEEWDEKFFELRIVKALEYRETVCAGWEARRLVYSEGDGLPGLIVDQYGKHLVVQSLTVGIERRLDEIKAALLDVINPESILLRGDSAFRKIEGLPETSRQLLGTTPEEIPFTEEGVRFIAHPHTGQKTGFYLDQRNNRGLIEDVAIDKRVLDLYSYTGAWGLRALAAGASQAVMVDSSQKALDWGAKDSADNGSASRSLFVQADVGDFLDNLIRMGEKYDIVILDPPSFIKSRKDATRGIAAYRSLNENVLRVVAEGGYLVSCSCSHLLNGKDHLSLIGRAARKQNRRIRVVKTGGQSPDHPILPGHPETEYLKCRVVWCE